MIATPARLLALSALLLAITGACAGLFTVRQDLAFTRAQTEISFWGRGSYVPEAATIARTGHSVDALLAQSHGHPQYLALAAEYAIWRSHWAQDMAHKSSFAGQALSRQAAALQSRPAHRQSWLKMVEYASRTRDGEAVLKRAQTRLQALHGN